jgi:hypothetical protein
MGGKLNDQDFINLFKTHGAAETARIIGTTERNVYKRRQRIEQAQGAEIPAPQNTTRWASQYPKRLPIEISDGIVMIGSDCHYWPDVITAAHRGFVELCKRLEPKIVILNGDAFDAARAGRHPRIGWEQSPTMKQEREAVLDRTHEIIAATPKAAHIWTIGNHDLRYESKLSANVPEMEGLPNTTLQDLFPFWDFAVSVWINDQVVVKHRFKGGIHATHNNTLWAGKTIVTGHLHSLKVTPLSDYNGTRWGIDTGTLADPASNTEGGPQFHYNEDNPQNHRSGFIVLSFKDGQLLWPEVCNVIDQDHVSFRGEVIKV